MVRGLNEKEKRREREGVWLLPFSVKMLWRGLHWTTMTTSTYSSSSTTFERDPDSFEDDQHNVWHQMLEVATLEESRQKILCYLKEEEVLKVARSWRDAIDTISGENPIEDSEGEQELRGLRGLSRGDDEGRLEGVPRLAA